ncbi:hypothetical protein OG883_44660 [Streptomyces sp. NBC_01142]|uniref:hypothetical protein n=1 Tax=Streptomyces sp. NBC_01142 TaxID=2975865 RepID=UPI00224D6A28|nr:hypothetical protein [Streptomyces sp. NBC_01142]MCX4826738.1 hypothetical protein [Streptomyces sp. NBC_01142]
MHLKPEAPRQATAREVEYLKAASVHQYGHLPPRVSPRLLKAMLDAEFIYREDSDGYRLTNVEALAYTGPTTWRITWTGRRAALSAAQWRDLTERVEENGAFTNKVHWVTRNGLAVLGLAEYRDDHGVVQPNDGGSGVHGPRFRAFRTELGHRVAQLAEADTVK